MELSKKSKYALDNRNKLKLLAHQDLNLSCPNRASPGSKNSKIVKTHSMSKAYLGYDANNHTIIHLLSLIGRCDQQISVDV